MLSRESSQQTEKERISERPSIPTEGIDGYECHRHTRKGENSAARSFNPRRVLWFFILSFPVSQVAILAGPAVSSSSLTPVPRYSVAEDERRRRRWRTSSRRQQRKSSQRTAGDVDSPPIVVSQAVRNCADQASAPQPKPRRQSRL